MELTPKTSKGDLTREKIVSAALVLFAKNGFSETSFQMIADECGMGQTAVLRHYQNKLTLFFAVVQSILKSNHQYVEKLQKVDFGAEKGLMTYCSGNIEWAIRYPEKAQIILLLYYFASVKPEFSNLYSKVLETGRNRVLHFFHAGQREGCFEMGSLSLQESAEVMHEAIIGVIINILTLRTRNLKTSELEALQKKGLRKLRGVLRALTQPSSSKH